MFRKQDFKKLDLLGSGKKHTKIYKVQHLGSGKIYALKEIEAKTLEKLNEYKEEAVQLSKVQNHPNVIKFYGYYFSETMYNTFRLGLITEYMDHTQVYSNYLILESGKYLQKKKKTKSTLERIRSSYHFIFVSFIFYNYKKKLSIFYLIVVIYNNEEFVIGILNQRIYFYFKMVK